MAGLPEVVLRPPLLADGPNLLDRAGRHAMELAREGFRVLAVARADRPAELAGTASGSAAAGDMERDLRLLGPVAILDPPRRSAATTIAACQAAGITPVLITGDHPDTARSIATELGIIGPGGPVIACRDAAAIADGAPHARVFARAAPELPFLRDLLGTRPLAPTDLLILCAFSTPGYAAIRLDRVLFPEAGRAPSGRSGSRFRWRGPGA